MPGLSRARLAALIAAAAMTALAATPASAYAVICKHGRYDIDSRSDEQLKIAFGTSYCSFRRFNFRSDAESFARNNRMTPGSPCSCR